MKFYVPQPIIPNAIIELNERVASVFNANLVKSEIISGYGSDKLHNAYINGTALYALIFPNLNILSLNLLISYLQV